PALQDAGARPGRERRLGRRDGVQRILLAGARVKPDHLVGVGRVDVLGPIGPDPLAVDEVLVQFGHDRSYASMYSAIALGAGTVSPSSCMPSTCNRMASPISASTSSTVAPVAMQPGRSGT